MTPEELAVSLRRAHESAPHNEKTLSVHLWAIKHAEDLGERGMAGAVIRSAGIGEWAATLNDMTKLARHVAPTETLAELQAENERLRKIILKMHQDLEHWRRTRFYEAGYSRDEWVDSPPPI